MNSTKVAVAVSKTISIIQLLAGIGLVFMFGVCTIMYITDKQFAKDTGIAFLIVCLVFVALGAWLIYISRKTSKLIKEFRSYVTAISNEPSGFIPDIAAALGASEDVVKSNLDSMIKRKFFSNAFIDRNSNCIVIANKQAITPIISAPQQTAQAFSAPNRTAALEMMTVRCKGCGGINTIAKGQVGECDYCGSAIKGE